MPCRTYPGAKVDIIFYNASVFYVYECYLFVGGWKPFVFRCVKNVCDDRRKIEFVYKVGYFGFLNNLVPLQPNSKIKNTIYNGWFFSELFLSRPVQLIYSMAPTIILIRELGAAVWLHTIRKPVSHVRFTI